jgi:hypothetical protein
MKAKINDDLNKIAFSYWAGNNPMTGGSVYCDVFFYEIQDELKAGFTIKEIKQMYEIR